MVVLRKRSLDRAIFPKRLARKRLQRSRANTMESPAKRAALVAVDLGAQSCRVSLLKWRQGRPHIRVVHRFPNAPITTQEGLRWDIGGIFDGGEDRLRLCREAAPE